MTADEALRVIRAIAENSGPTGVTLKALAHDIEVELERLRTEVATLGAERDDGWG